MPGVLAVYTGAELAAAGIKPMPTTPDFRRADGRRRCRRRAARSRTKCARYVGEAVVAVVAESREAARDAIDSVVVEYEELPAVADVAAATAPGAPALAPDARRQHRRRDAPRRCREGGGGVRARRGPHRARPRQPARLAGGDGAAQHRRLVRRGERAADGADQQPDADRGRGRPRRRAARTSTQEQVHVLVGDVGGGFGMKTGMYPEDIVVAHAARALGRPVHWQADRSEEFLSALGTGATSPATSSSRSTATARRWRCACARSPTSAPTRRRPGVAIQLLIGPWVSTSIYDIAVVDLHTEGGADEHDADRRLPRRRPAGGDLHHRAAVRRGGARDEARSRPSCAAAT